MYCHYMEYSPSFVLSQKRHCIELSYGTKYKSNLRLRSLSFRVLLAKVTLRCTCALRQFHVVFLRPSSFASRRLPFLPRSAAISALLTSWQNRWIGARQPRRRRSPSTVCDLSVNWCLCFMLCIAFHGLFNEGFVANLGWLVLMILLLTLFALALCGISSRLICSCPHPRWCTDWLLVRY